MWLNEANIKMGNECSVSIICFVSSFTIFACTDMQGSGNIKSQLSVKKWKKCVKLQFQRLIGTRCPCVYNYCK